MKQLLATLLLAFMAGAASAEVLTVCDDPNNMPFSNREQQGLENKLVALLARDLHLQVRYVWWAQRRGFARNTLAQARCDLWPGVAQGVSNMQTSQPYYRSTYVFVTRAADNLRALSLDDARLRKLRIGVEMVGYNGANTPPALALAARGLTHNVRGFMLFGDYAQPNPTATIIDAVAHGTVDVALVWGPLAGYFAPRAATTLSLEPVADEPRLPMSYNISVGLRRGETALAGKVDAALRSERGRVDALLRDYHFPRPDVARGSFAGSLARRVETSFAEASVPAAASHVQNR